MTPVGFIDWADDKLERYLRRRGMGDIRREPTEIEVEHAERGRHRRARPPLAGHCPCGATWLHNEHGDVEGHRAWLKRDTR
jgi:hypothetical protein